MARRTVNESSLFGAEAGQYRWLENNIQSREPDPLEWLIASEGQTDVWVRVFLTGCRPWPAPPDSHGRCGVCHDLPLASGWYCGACDRPKGSQARHGANPASPPIRVKGGKRVKPETRRERRERKREAA